MGRPITNITIVGGGTAGWLAAAYLNYRLQWGPLADPTSKVTITVIESPQVGIIGVGESTLPTLKFSLKYLEISEPEFMSRADAVFKVGIWFDGWNMDKTGKPVGYMHPFTGGKTIGGVNPGYPFKRFGIPGHPNATDQDFVRTISAAREAFEGNRGPRDLHGAHYDGPLQYAYHINAANFAEFLAEVCRSRGVQHVRDNLLDVKLDDRGYISALQLQEKGDWPVELVIDCTGFRSLLMGKALGEPFLSFSDYLLNDRAIPMQVKHRDPRRIAPVTGAIAMDAGWAWHIPLRHRVGAGYVFCSQFKSDDQALAELRALLGAEAEGCEPQPILKPRVGRSQRSWVKNCIALGLAGGFMEPLESQSIMGTELAVQWLINYLPTADFEEPLANQFNFCVNRLYDEVRDFIQLHYLLSQRQGPYWDTFRNDAKRSDTLKGNLELWKYSLPGPSDPGTRRVYNHWSQLSVLMGKNFYEDCRLVGGGERISLHLWQQFCAQNNAAKQSALARLASHNDLLEHMYAQALSGKSAIRTTDTKTIFSEANVLATARPIMSDT